MMQELKTREGSSAERWAIEEAVSISRVERQTAGEMVLPESRSWDHQATAENLEKVCLAGAQVKEAA